MCACCTSAVLSLLWLRPTRTFCATFCPRNRMAPHTMATTIQPLAAPWRTSLPQGGSSAPGTVGTERSQWEGGGMAPSPEVGGGMGGGATGAPSAAGATPGGASVGDAGSPAGWPEVG